MSFASKLKKTWEVNNSLVCVGLDSDLNKIPEHLKKEKQPLFAFNRAIIDSTADLVCAYKPNIAFYSETEAEDELLATINYIHSSYPLIPVILDSKRGDIGNTAEMYAKESFKRFKVDAVTVNPYLGGDSIEPFLQYADKGIIILCRTSNPGGADIQNLQSNGKPIYLHVADLAKQKWNKNNNVSLVVGGTAAEELANVRNCVGDDIPFLVPGIGAQGGDTENAIRSGKNSKGTGLIINSSRGIIYAGSGLDFAKAARNETIKLRDEINKYR